MARHVNQPRSVYEALNLYTIKIQASESEQKAYVTIAQIQSTLLRYILPAIGFPALKGRKITELEKQAGLERLKQVPLEKIQELPEALKRSFEKLSLSKGNQRIQRYTLNRFITWCQSQPWWVNSAFQDSASRTERKEETEQIRTTTRRKQKPYGLRATKANQIPQQLQQELDEFYEFRINSPTQALVAAVKAETAKNDLKNIDLFLGWLHHYKLVTIDQLNLQKLAPSAFKVTYEDVEQGDQVSLEGFGYIWDYIDWLQISNDSSGFEEDSRSYYTIINILQTSIIVNKFLHYKKRQGVQKEEYENLTAVKAIRREIRKIRRIIQNEPHLTTNSEQNLDWIEFLQLVEALRLECGLSFLDKNLSRRNRPSQASRTVSAIALSLQRFLMVALFAYLPLRSRISYRYLKFFASDDSQVVLDYLSFDQGYLFLNDKIWWIKLFGSLLWFGEREGTPILKVPNLTYSDGTTFYDYLNAWLVHYSSSDGHAETGGLRACFHPQHSYLFTKKNGQPYQNATEFANVLRNASYRITGKTVTPNSIKQIFEHYMQTQGYSETLLDSLATAIGQSREDLRKIYLEQTHDNKALMSELVQRLSKQE